MENQTDAINEILANQKEKISEKDFKFYHVARFFVLVEKATLQAGQCPECNRQKNTAETTLPRVSELINGNVTTRREYEKIYSELLNHLKKAHGFSIKGSDSSLYALIGMVAGALAGWLFSMTIDPQYLRISILGGTAIGMIAGKLLGNKKEKKFSEQNKFL